MGGLDLSRALLIGKKMAERCQAAWVKNSMLLPEKWAKTSVVTIL